MLDRLSPVSTRFRRALRSENLEIRAGLSSSRIREFESRFKVHLPPDMRRFYRRVDGMASSEWGFGSFMRILPLGEVRPVYQEFADAEDPQDAQPRAAFVIGDQSIGAYFYAIDLVVPRNPVYMVLRQPMRVATGFSEFVVKVMADSRDLFHGENAS